MRLRSFAPAAPLALIVLSLCAGEATGAAPAGPTKMLTQPALSAERVAFVHGNDLWTSRLDDSGVQRITSGPGMKTSPAFSPDGALLAFTAELDGKAVLFASPREAFNNRQDHGKTIAYTPNRPMHLQWKRYRGGTVSRIWLYDVATHAVVKVPQPEGRCNDLTPAWVGETIYLTSDRDGEFNDDAFDAKA